MEIALPSCAKINWGLWILGKRKDGYHEIFTPIQKINLCDRVYIKSSDTLRIETSNGIPQGENFVYKGLKLFEKITGIEPKLSIFIEKRIPVGGGLGGGSSNLTTVLEFVNNLYGKPLNREELSNLAAEVSSDAPAFLCKGIALATGRGEKVNCLKPSKFWGVGITLLVPESVSSPTGLIYSKVKPTVYSKPEEVKQIEGFILRSSPEEFFKLAKNPLGDIFLDLNPSIGEDIDFLSKKCYKKFLISGSGSSLFTVGSLDWDCLNSLDSLKNRYKIISLAAI